MRTSADRTTKTLPVGEREDWIIASEAEIWAWTTVRHSLPVLSWQTATSS
jgi:hypothetical protein